MTYTARWTKAVLLVFLAVGIIGFAASARAAVADLPLAAASPLTGVSFDDKPLLLPVQRNFQMAMLTASSELGRSCGKMEAYGWRMNQTEQGRVNQIFNNTVDRLRLLGYNIAPQVLASVSNDITLFTADSPTRHFLFLWSAGELGLVLNVCQTTAPAPSSAHPMNLVPSVQVFPVPDNIVSSDIGTVRKKDGKASGGFAPVGEWTGGYTCAQGYTGGTLKINEMRGKNFEGVFKFYPTVKNPSVPAGSYNVYGQYDAESNRILINPGKWIYRPKNFYNTVIVGGFDPMRDTFSAYFQGISGCTSFEANRGDEPNEDAVVAKPHKKHVVKKKKTVVKKKPTVAQANVDQSNIEGNQPKAAVDQSGADGTPPAPVDAPAAPAAATPLVPTSISPTPASPPFLAPSGSSAVAPGIPLGAPPANGK